MEWLIVCRHAQSAFNVRGVINGDPSIAGPLSPLGHSQASALGAALRDRAIDLCVTTEFGRTIETADIALAGRTVPRLVVPELSDSPLGVFELRPVEEFGSWRKVHGPDEPLPGTDVSERRWLVRVRDAFSALAERREPTILFIGHGAAVSWLLASAGRPDTAGHAQPLTLSSAEVRDALTVTREDVFARWPAPTDPPPPPQRDP